VPDETEPAEKLPGKAKVKEVAAVIPPAIK
jgi:hypothetical protein